MWFDRSIERLFMALFRLGIVFAVLLVLATLAGTGYGVVLMASTYMGLHGATP